MVQAILKKYIPAYEVWAFGSRINGRAKKHSDLDLVAITKQRLSLHAFGDIKDAFSESNLPMMVDILDWSRISESFRKIILEDYLILQHPSAENLEYIEKVKE
jgi:uncharacterized protein